jgi:hypothetical protein
MDNNIIFKNINIYDFYKKYKYFNIQEFKILNKKLSNMNYINIIIYYHLNYITENLLGSIKDFYIKYPT